MNSTFPAPEVFYDADRPLKLGYQTYLATPAAIASYTFLLYALSGAAFAAVRCSHFTRNHRSYHGNDRVLDVVAAGVSLRTSASKTTPTTR
jgi:hypothetical protein